MISPMTVSVIQYKLEAIARLVGVEMERTAISQLLNQAHDFSAAVFDSSGRLLAQAEHIPIHIGAMQFAVRDMIRSFKETISEGDVLISNDPYSGGSHLPDITLVRPVIYNGSIHFFMALRAHHNDIGGSAHGGYNADAYEIFQEGVRIPPLKLVENGRLRADVLNLLASNVRHAEEFMGDLQAQMGATAIGCDQLTELLSRYGTETVSETSECLMNGSQQAMETEISTWKEGIHLGESLLDDDGRGRTNIPIRARVTLNDGTAVVDLSESAGQLDSFLNSSWANTCSAVFVAFMYVTRGRIPMNEGTFRPIRITAPPGSIVNPTPPAPVGACTTHVGSEIVEAVLLALAQAVPEKALAGYARRFRCSISGINERTGLRYIWHLFYGRGGAGASRSADGWSNLGVIINPGGIRAPSIEITEQQFPFRIHRYEFRPDSGGAGTLRGGAGTIFEMELTDSDEATINTSGDGVDIPPYGLQGGHPGRPHDFFILSGEKRRVLGTKSRDIPLHRGDILCALSAGGGGYGKPEERDPEQIADDLKNGIITESEYHTHYHRHSGMTDEMS